MDCQGLFFISESEISMYFFLLSLITFYMVCLLTNNFFLNFLSFTLVVLRFLFFYVWSFILFFIFFELSSIPVILITLIYGVQVEKFNAIYYLVFYRFLTGLPFLVILLYLIRENYFFGLVFFECKLSSFYCLLVVLCFLIKFPVYFLHFWLPKMHVEASTLASILLAGLLLKFGVYGFYRVLYVLKFEYLGLFFTVAFIGIFIGIFIRIVQRDIKRQVAYSSVCHIGFTLLSFFYFSEISLERVILSSLRHGFLRTLIFWLAGEIYYQRGTRLVYYIESEASRRIYNALFQGVTLLISSSIPLVLGYFSEYGLLYLVEMYEFFYYLFVLYFFLDFYISVYLFTITFSGKGFKAGFLFLLRVALGFLIINLSFYSFQ